MLTQRDKTAEPADRVPLSARLMRGWNVDWWTPHASGRTTTIARTFSEACRNIGELVPGAQCTARVIR